MKSFLSKILFSFIGLNLFLVIQAKAQCAMCSLNAQASVQGGNTQGFGLNDGIMFLLAMPYLAVLVIGVIWYKKYRKKATPLEPKTRADF